MSIYGCKAKAERSAYLLTFFPINQQLVYIGGRNEIHLEVTHCGRSFSRIILHRPIQIQMQMHKQERDMIFGPNVRKQPSQSSLYELFITSLNRFYTC